jgi:hypothetical protein
MSLESSATLWDAISFWLIGVGAALAFVGTVAAVHARKLGRELATEKTAIAAREKVASDRAIAEANARAAEAALELAKFKAPRSLTKEQEDQLIAKLKPFSGQLFSFNVTADPEAISFLRIIRTVLNRAGWNEIPSQYGDVSVGGVGVSTDTGITLEVAANADMAHVALVQLLDSALNAEGIQSIPRHNKDLTNLSAINILVGKKP